MADRDGTTPPAAARAGVDPTAGRWHGVAAGVVFAAIAVSVAPRALHEESLALLGLPSLPVAAAGTPLAAGWRAAVHALAGLGPGLHLAATLLAAVAGGVAVWAVHGLAHTGGATRRGALVAAGFTALTPAAVVAATSVHVHSLVLALAAVATWLAAAAGRAGSLRSAVLAGTWCGAAHAAAPDLAFLPAVALPGLAFTAARHGHGAGRVVGLVAAVLSVDLATAGLLTWGRWTAGLPTAEAVLAYDLATLGPLAWRDAGRSFLPLSLVVLAAAWAPSRSRAALALLAAATVHLLFGCHRTATLGDDGAFLLPVLPAAALLAAAWLSPRTAIAALLAAAALSAAKLALASDRHACAEFTAGVHEVSAGRPLTLVIGPRRDEAFVLAGMPAVAPTRLPTAAASVGDAPAAWVRDLSALARAGRCTVLTDEAEAALRDPWFRARHAGAPELLRQLEQAFTWRFVQARGFAGRELVPR